MNDLEIKQIKFKYLKLIKNILLSIIIILSFLVLFLITQYKNINTLFISIIILFVFIFVFVYRLYKKKCVLLRDELNSIYNIKSAIISANEDIHKS